MHAFAYLLALGKCATLRHSHVLDKVLVFRVREVVRRFLRVFLVAELFFIGALIVLEFLPADIQ